MKRFAHVVVRKERESSGETIGHMLLECRRWDNSPRIHLSGVMNKVGAIERSKQGRRILLSEGSYMDQKLVGWLPAKQGSSFQPSHEGDGTRGCIAFQVAVFLKEIATTKHTVPSQLKKDLGEEAQDSPLQSQGPMDRVSLGRQGSQ